MNKQEACNHCLHYFECLRRQHAIAEDLFINICNSFVDERDVPWPESED